MTSLGGEKKIEKVRLESKDAESYASSDAKLSDPLETAEFGSDSSSAGEGKKKKADDAIRLATALESSSSGGGGGDVSRS